MAGTGGRFPTPDAIRSSPRSTPHTRRPRPTAAAQVRERSSAPSSQSAVIEGARNSIDTRRGYVTTTERSLLDTSTSAPTTARGGAEDASPSPSRTPEATSGIERPSIRRGRVSRHRTAKAGYWNVAVNLVAPIRTSEELNASHVDVVDRPAAQAKRTRYVVGSSRAPACTGGRLSAR
jgi:hypothetical protein